MKLGYARVSTQDQSLDLQIDALNTAGCDEIYREKVSGTKDNRPELKRLLSYARQGDTLVIYKLDRLGRSTKKLLELAEELEQRGIELVSIRDQIDTSTAVGKAMFRMLMVLAEMERDVIVERTRAGLEAARARGKVGGRPVKYGEGNAKLTHAIELYNAKEKSVPEIERITGISKATLYRALKKAGASG
ncbi:recombinase family protein [Brevibacillus brevis]|uniref:recombinase family protein n=1 Tax=Brevibacillus brevis TaxID=1393 RepID=UPI001C8D6CCA|nr:recombinase family protein [Brevibacillus brevis]MBY0083719.1 recombinase family protein [Brevibacillus brevis]